MEQSAHLPFSEGCRQACGSWWERSVRHPFVRALARGALHPDQVAVYLEQDRLYLIDYVQICLRLAEFSTQASDRNLFIESARLSEEAEDSMQGVFRERLGLATRAPAGPLPATVAYTTHERTCAAGGSRLVAMAAATPCNWTYAEIGRWLGEASKCLLPDHPYAEWIALYAGNEVQTFAARWVACLNRWAEGTSPVDRDAARAAFVRSVALEVSFWDQAWQAGPRSATP